MSLEDLNRKLYGSSEGLAKRFDERNAQADTEQPFRVENWSEPERGLDKKQRTIVYSLGGFLLLLLLGFLSFYAYGVYARNSFQQDRVYVEIRGPKEVDSMQPQRFTVYYQNRNRVKLRNAEVILEYGENFQPTIGDSTNLLTINSTSSRITLGDLKANSEGEFEFKGSFYAPKDFPVYLRGSLNYQPADSGATLQNKNQFGVTVRTAPIGLDVSVPSILADGDQVEIVIDYKNLDIRRINNAQIKLDYPGQFKFLSSEPFPSNSQNDTWYVGSLEENQSGKIRVRGTLSGGQNEVKQLKVVFGYVGPNDQIVVFNQVERSIKMAAPILAITQEITNLDGGNVDAGQAVNYLVKYKNNGNIGLRDAIVTAELLGIAWDYSKIILETGNFDLKTKTITWKAADLPQLAKIDPAGGGEIRFSLPTTQRLPANSETDKNFTISTLLKIDSPDIPTPIDANKIVGSNRLDLKVNTKVFLETLGYYADKNLPNLGPIPMKVGQETTFTLYWGVTNVSNDLKEVKVSSILPPGARFTGKTYPENEKISYNERTNEINWEPNVIVAGVGLREPRRMVAFQIAITPQPSELGTEPRLLGSSKLVAKDSFTGKEFFLETKEKTSQLTEDVNLSFDSFKVVGP